MNTIFMWSINREVCIYVFGAITLFIVITINIKTFAFVMVCMKASTNLHNNIFSALIRAKINFFNTNLSGQDYFNKVYFVLFLLTEYIFKFIL